MTETILSPQAESKEMPTERVKELWKLAYQRGKREGYKEGFEDGVAAMTKTYAEGAEKPV